VAEDVPNDAFHESCVERLTHATEEWPSHDVANAWSRSFFERATSERRFGRH
jgi:hypothetical protein